MLCYGRELPLWNYAEQERISIKRRYGWTVTKGLGMAMESVEALPISEEDVAAGREKLDRLKNNLASVIQGKPRVLDAIVTALAANGSVLMEDVPGVGKTTLAKALAASLEAKFNRVQFTPDLLPADILGGSIYNPQDGSLTFHPGPIFCNILLADEINRASPRTQSALLEAMAERQVTIENQRHPLSELFMVIGTENPIEFHGTYPLPEAQLDRFMMRLELGYPDPDTEVSILYSQTESHPVDDVRAVLAQSDMADIQRQVRRVAVEPTVAAYIVELVNQTRRNPNLKLGASPRGSLMLFRACQAAAYADGRSYVMPDDAHTLAVPVLAHRIILHAKARYDGTDKAGIIHSILEDTPIPA